jgi:hypothetical protein
MLRLTASSVTPLRRRLPIAIRQPADEPVLTKTIAAS